MNKKYPIYMLLFPEHELEPKEGDIFRVMKVDRDYDDDAHTTVWIVYLEPKIEYIKLENRSWD